MRYEVKFILLTLISNVFTKQMPGICLNDSQGLVNYFLLECFRLLLLQLFPNCNKQFNLCFKLEILLNVARITYLMENPAKVLLKIYQRLKLKIVYFFKFI